MIDRAGGENEHPVVRAWIRSHPHVPFGQQPDDPAVGRLVSELGLGVVERDLGGEDNLSVVVDQGRHVLRTYKPFVSRDRVIELQRLRANVRAAGLTTPVPVVVAGKAAHRCGWRWAEVEPYLSLPDAISRLDDSLFRGLGRLHRVLAALPSLTTSDLRRSFVSVEILREWVELNWADGLMSSDRARSFHQLLSRIERRWVRPDSLPAQMIHADPHAANILPAADGTFVYLDFSGVEVAPRVHDLAMALVYHFARPGGSSEIAAHVPRWLETYAGATTVDLSDGERAAIPAYAAAVACYYDICGWGPKWGSLGADLLALPGE